jgi:hypothetical protein
LADISSVIDLEIAQTSTPSNPVVTVARKISDSDTTLITSTTLLNKDGTVITKACILGIKKSNGYLENVYVAAGGITGTTVTITTRGLKLGGIDFTATLAGNAVSHEQGEEVFLNVAPFLLQEFQDALQGDIGSGLKLNARPTYTGTNAVYTERVFADATARDAAITAPQNGDRCYNTADGVFQKYQTGAWADDATGTTANGSTTVAGKFEEATQAEIDAATATGGTGAQLTVNPASLATSIYGVRLPSANEKIYLTALESSGTTVVEIDQALDGISANVTAANLGTLTGGGATTLHSHAQICDSWIMTSPVFTSSQYTRACATVDAESIYVCQSNTTVVTIYRYIRDSATDLYNYSTSATLAVNSGEVAAITSVGSYVYVSYKHTGPSNRIHRFDLDLTNGTNMTLVNDPAANINGNWIAGSGSNLYLVLNNNAATVQFYPITVSGTTATYGSLLQFSGVAYDNTNWNGGAYTDGTHIYIKTISGDYKATVAGSLVTSNPYPSIPTHFLNFFAKRTGVLMAIASTPYATSDSTNGSFLQGKSITKV